MLDSNTDRRAPYTHTHTYIQLHQHTQITHRWDKNHSHRSYMHTRIVWAVCMCAQSTCIWFGAMTGDRCRCLCCRHRCCRYRRRRHNHTQQNENWTIYHLFLFCTRRQYIQQAATTISSERSLCMCGETQACIPMFLHQTLRKSVWIVLSD